MGTMGTMSTVGPVGTVAVAGAPAWSPRRPWAGGWLLVALLVQMGAGGLLFLADRHRPATAPRGRTLVEMRWLPSLPQPPRTPRTPRTPQRSDTPDMPRPRSAPTPSPAPPPSAQDRTPRHQAFVAPSTPGSQTEATDAPAQRTATDAVSPPPSGLTARPAPLVLLMPSTPASAPQRPTLMEQLKADPRSHSAPRDLAYRMADAAGNLPQVIQSSTSATGSSLVKRGSGCQRVYENRMKSLAPTDERLKDAPSVAGSC